MRVLTVVALVALALISPVAMAEDTAPPGMATEAPEAEWQNIITQQIEAFRKGDGVAALGLAGQGFKDAFDDADQFYMSIAMSGYAPLVQSRAHSFGAFEMVGADGVMQTVTIVGPDQHLYSAIYELAREPEGWRVQGVQMTESRESGFRGRALWGG